MRRHDLFDHLTTVVIPCRAWPGRRGARPPALPGAGPHRWLASPGLLALGLIVQAVV